MNLSAIAVGTTPDRLDVLTEQINALPWAEVYHSDGKGRLIVMVEGETTGEEIEYLRQLKAMAGVGFAEMVVHYFGEEEQLNPEDTSELVPEYLSNEEELPGANQFQRFKNTGNY